MPGDISASWSGRPASSSSTQSRRRAPQRHAPHERGEELPGALPEVPPRTRSCGEGAVPPSVRSMSPRGSLRSMIAVLIAAALLAALAPGPTGAQAQRSPVILSTTTSTQDSGLLDVLVPMFERQSGYTVKTVAIGTGQALALAARGEADVVLAHAPELEKKYVADGKMLNRRLVMYSDFVIIGPADDPAKIKGMTVAAQALKAIAQTGSRFVSRGDNSGTHILEKSLWKLAGVEPAAPWYIESGQGMGQTLSLADEKN